MNRTTFMTALLISSIALLPACGCYKKKCRVETKKNGQEEITESYSTETTEDGETITKSEKTVSKF